MIRLYSLPIIVLFFCLVSCSSPSDQNEYLLTGLNIVDTETGEIHAGQSIWVKDGIIEDIFDDGTKETGPELIQDLSGKYAIPGLWDMHIHLRGRELASSNKKLIPLYVAHGVTTVRDAGGDLTDSVFAWKSQIANGTLTGPNIFTSGPKLDGPDGTWEGSIEVTNSEEVKAALDSLQAMNVDYVKIYDSRLSAEAYMEILLQAESREMKTTGHMPMTVLIKDALNAGLDGVEHLYYVMKGTSEREPEITVAVQNGEIGFWTAVRQLLDSYDEERAQKFYQKLAERDVAVVPTVHIDNVLSYLHEEDHSMDEFLEYIPADIQQTYNRRLNSALRRDQGAIDFEIRLNEHFKKMVKDLQEAGVTLMAGSDAGAYNSFVYPGLSLHKELQVFQESGLTPLQSLQTATVNAAAFFGEHNIPGNLLKGKQANITILNANPLEDIRNTTAIYSVINHGEFLSKFELNQLFTSY